MAQQSPQVPAADIAIIGAGTAGCLLAARLSESGAHRVVLFEAGPEDSNRWINVPFGMQMLMTNPAVNWLYESEPVAGLGGRRLFEPRGKVVGGTGAINASLYVRGNPADYDGWRDAGCPGWGYADVLPVFRKSECQQRGADKYHGATGPMGVSDGPGDGLSRTFLEATQELNLPQTDDFNGARQDGFGRFQTTTSKNIRQSTARNLLDPARGRGNLEIITGAQVTRVDFDGLRAVGVRYRVGGEERYLKVAREIVVAAGTFNSPQLLELSGIGDGAMLQSIGVPVLHHLPGVGANLQEHVGVKVIYRVAAASLSLNRIGRNPLRKALAAARYVAGRSGPLAWTNTFAGGFARSHDDLPAPDIQITVNAWSALGFSRDGLKPHSFPGVTFNAYHLTPQSRGSVHAGGPDPMARPKITVAALETDYDRAAIRAGIRLVRRILGTKAFTEAGVTEMEPGRPETSDAQLDAFARDKMVAMLHPVGTCRMGSDDKAVVDPALRVRGVSGLRVVDASVMPNITRGNTNAPTVMIAEKAATMILDDLRA
ncbi:GMC family oxidoreductase [Bradyrhizobium sp.]|uniref:GMC family oxidoreductase n=1 Tax=Bradyrhizobium sp. TaxID=376 RepID=UPI0039E326F3